MKFEPLQSIRLLTISRRLALGFGLLIVVFLAYGVYSVDSTTKIGERTRDLHAHPMSVQRAVLEAELGIVKIHRAMKDVSLARSDEQSLRDIEQILAACPGAARVRVQNQMPDDVSRLGTEIAERARKILENRGP